MLLDSLYAWNKSKHSIDENAILVSWTNPGTRIDGSRVVFTRAHGPDGAFDVLTGQFVEP